VKGVFTSLFGIILIVLVIIVNTGYTIDTKFNIISIFFSLFGFILLIMGALIITKEKKKEVGMLK
jgi:hypothetical protein